MKDIEVYRDGGPVAIAAIEAFEQNISINFIKNYYRSIMLYSDFDYLSTGKNFIHFMDLLYLNWIPMILSAFSFLVRKSNDHVIVFDGDYCFDYRDDPKTDEPKVVVIHDDVDDRYDAGVSCSG